MLDAIVVFNRLFADITPLQDVQSALANAAIFRVAESVTTGVEHQCWKLRKQAYLNRACDLACQPVHLRLAEIANGELIDCWYSYAWIATDSGRSQIESVFLGYADQMNEDQARARAMGY